MHISIRVCGDTVYRRYHNFTYMKHPSETSALRYITSFTSSDPMILGADSAEWVCLSVVGQSFLLNQIRKMVALVVEVVRGAAASRVLEEVFEAENKVGV
jgi:tRNA pseudouridine38-40 synthase